MEADDISVHRFARSVLSAVAAVTITVTVVTLVAEPGAAFAAPSAGPTTAYTVTNGDSLVGIANSFGIKVSVLLQANDLTLASVIQPGDVLTVPAAAPGASAGAATNGSGPVVTTAYQVHSGEALAGIARANGVTLGALMKANGLSSTSVIHPGQTIQLPPATRPIPSVAAPKPTSAPATGIPTPAPVAPASTATVSTSPGGKVDAVLAYARQQVGVPYRFFAAGPDAFDCSGLVVASYRQVGMNLPHYSGALGKVGVAVDWTTEMIRPGDLVLTASTATPTVISHVGIAIDDTTWIQAVGVGRTVSIGRMPVDAKILGVRRVV